MNEKAKNRNLQFALNQLRKRSQRKDAKLHAFAALEATDGSTLYIDGEPVVGAKVLQLTEGGEYIEAGDGVYVVDGVTYTIAGGIIADIAGGATDEGEALEGEGGEETAEAAVEAIEVPEEVAEVGDGAADVVDVNALNDGVIEIIDIIKDSTDDVETLKAEVAELKEVVAEFSKMAAKTNGKPATQHQFNAVSKLSQTNEKMQRLLKNFGKQ